MAGEGDEVFGVYRRPKTFNIVVAENGEASLVLAFRPRYPLSFYTSVSPLRGFDASAASLPQGCYPALPRYRLNEAEMSPSSLLDLRPRFTYHLASKPLTLSNLIACIFPDHHF